MMTTYVSADIERFAAAVRENLSDLSAEEVEELTGGLEADLAEELNERPADSDLRDPEGYALELRMAAGLPPRQAPKQKSISGIIAAVRRMRAEVTDTLRDNAVLAAVLDFTSSLRPAWWLVRAWVAFQVVSIFTGGTAGILPHGSSHWLALAVVSIVSVQWGRGKWLPYQWLRGLIVVGNIAAALVLIPAIAEADGAGYYGGYAGSYAAPVEDDGLAFNGEPVLNIYPYDASGTLLSGVQLFDADGNRLTSRIGEGSFCADEYCGQMLALVPSTLETGATVYNVYPRTLAEAQFNPETGRGEPVEGSDVAPDPPFIKVPGLLEQPEPKADQPSEGPDSPK